jgi:PAS domain S-box-containing protein
MILDITDRNRTQGKLRVSEGGLRLALESGRMYVFEWDLNSDVIQPSAECMAVLGIPSCSEEKSGKQLLNRIHPGDRQRYMNTLRDLTPAHDTYLTSYRKLLPDGRNCWIEVRGRGFFDCQGNLLRVVGIASDITARKEAEDSLRELSSRLITAQEEERSRLARELHDGVSQGLTVISLGIAQAAKAATNADLSSKLEKLNGKLQDVLSDISQLSHELHPSTLKHLGLPLAIRSLCQELSETHGVDVDFTAKSEQQPPSQEASLCLYRVAQEALQNVVKHSRSKRAWVELRDSADDVRLCICDEGIGFDARSRKSGLGLISMRERLRLVGGRITISSRHPSGTCIEAHVPLVRGIKAAA